MMYALILCNILGFAAAPALQAIFSKAVDARSQGSAMGSLTALDSIMTVCAAFAGTGLLGQVSHLPHGSVWLGAPFFMASAAQAISLTIAYRHLKANRAQQVVDVKDVGRQ
jgi:DHA1 family tetracycline resistance protein-like MFS transporter